MEKMDVIGIARELGRQLQQEEVYINYSLAKQAADEDEELQSLISEFNDIRVKASGETEKPVEDRDQEKVRKLNDDMRKVYAKIMTNERMIQYNDTKDALDFVLQRITAIIEKSSMGEDPDTADYEASCSGNCSACGGCG